MIPFFLEVWSMSFEILIIQRGFCGGCGCGERLCSAKSCHHSHALQKLITPSPKAWILYCHKMKRIKLQHLKNLHFSHLNPSYYQVALNPCMPSLWIVRLGMIVAWVPASEHIKFRINSLDFCKYCHILCGGYWVEIGGNCICWQKITSIDYVRVNLMHQPNNFLQKTAILYPHNNYHHLFIRLIMTMLHSDNTNPFSLSSSNWGMKSIMEVDHVMNAHLYQMTIVTYYPSRVSGNSEWWASELKEW